MQPLSCSRRKNKENSVYGPSQMNIMLKSQNLLDYPWTPLTIRIVSHFIENELSFVKIRHGSSCNSAALDIPVSFATGHRRGASNATELSALDRIADNTATYASVIPCSIFKSFEIVSLFVILRRWYSSRAAWTFSSLRGAIQQCQSLTRDTSY